jgi:hypothetical protein
MELCSDYLKVVVVIIGKMGNLQFLGCIWKLTIEGSLGAGRIICEMIGTYLFIHKITKTMNSQDERHK